MLNFYLNHCFDPCTFSSLVQLFCLQFIYFNFIMAHLIQHSLCSAGAKCIAHEKFLHILSLSWVQIEGALEH